MAEDVFPDEDDASVDDGEPKPPEAKSAPAGGKLRSIIGIALVTIVAVTLGAGLGMQTASEVEHSIEERAKAVPAEGRTRSAVYSGDVMLQNLDPVITNLASPADVWIRLEAAIVFSKGAIENPAVTGAEIQQDILAYARTVKLAQLEGPSALQHLREDLNERVSVRTGGKVSELIIQSLVVQ
jgi:flagellar FliL protein